MAVEVNYKKGVAQYTAVHPNAKQLGFYFRQ